MPSRQQPGSFYALPQSPQLFKQLLMVAGIDRYYQMARCLRDEDLRADRQYEFMQLDAEMSFVDQDDVHTAIGNAVIAAARAAGQDPGEIVKITWHEAMNRFGVDKPDLRFGMELTELTDAFAATEFKAFAGAASIKGINAAGKADEYGRNKLDALTDKAKQMGAKGLVWLKVAADGALESPVAKFLSEAEQAALQAAPRRAARRPAADRRRRVGDDVRGARPAAQRPRPPARARGPVPLPVGRRLPDVRRRRRRSPGTPEAGPPPVHPAASRRRAPARDRPDGGAQPGLRPRAQRLGARDRVRSESTSPSCSPGSSGCSASATRRPTASFGFFLNPFRYGAPPHGGFAFGIDRLVAILAGEENIREVIAFPKTQSGTDPMTNAPTPVAPKQLDELGIRVLPKVD